MKYMQLAAGLLLMLVFSGLVLAAEKEASSVHVSHAYVNSAPPGTNVTAGFLEIKNTGETEIELIGVSSPSVEKVGLHSTETINGEMRMQMLNGLTIYTGDTIRFEHGGLHLMLWGLDKSLQPGSTVPLTLHFSGGLKKTVRAELRDIRVKKSPSHEH